MEIVLAILSCLLIGLGLFHLYYRKAQESVFAQRLHAKEHELFKAEQRVIDLGQDLRILEAKHQTLQENHATLRAEKQLQEEHFKALRRNTEEDETRLKERFAAVSQEALRSNTESFLALANDFMKKIGESSNLDHTRRLNELKKLVEPVEQSLLRVSTSIDDVEKLRLLSFDQIKQQLSGLATTHQQLRDETLKLANTLNNPAQRGKWGELQLRRAVEIAGMMEHCDFIEQPTILDSDNHSTLKPDMLITLPGGKKVIVDAKAPLDAYLKSAEDEGFAKKHAEQLRARVLNLAKKAYWKHLNNTPEFVVMFLPGEDILRVALDEDPGILEFGLDRHVVFATPTTLIALLRTIAFSWRSELLSENAQKIIDVGGKIHDALHFFNQHLAEIGKHLGQSTRAYNAACFHLDSKLAKSVAELEQLHISNRDKERLSLEGIHDIPKERVPLEPIL
jgi:DNA recombination protein RmuC